jgi:3-oxoadipate enol-lactonase
VLVHAGVADSRQWDAVWPALTARHRVLRYDARGYGRSTLPGGEFSHADDLARLLGDAGFDRAALVASSLGSRIALELALRAPRRIRALVVAPPGLFAGRSDAVLRFGDAEEEAFERGDLDAAVALNVDLWVAGPSRGLSSVDPRVVETVREMQRRAFELELAALDHGLAPGPERVEPDLAGRLHEIDVPTLVLVGDADVPDVLASAELLEREVPRARRVVVPGVAHMLAMERPAEVVSYVLDFLARNDEEA